MRSWGRLYLVLSACWLAAFGIEAVRLARAATGLWRVNWRLEDMSETLQRRSREITDLTGAIRALDREREFIGGLPNFLPQDKSYLRTQGVIAEEVGALRRKVGKKLKGSLHVLVDSKANKLYLKKGVKLLWQADCSVGRGGTLRDRGTGRRWEFVTPRGEFRVIGKAVDPQWLKPDWAYVEAKQDIPPPDDPARKVSGELGAYVLNLGDGYLIHGTRNEELLGRPASHGCVRLGAADLKNLFEAVPAGTKVYIY
ncbi:MAG: L,D-transpeptidase [Elusimicrobia bacterium]|nr:L,D-transpeptidase [Elusimicrobiota bacterium]